MPSVRLSMGEQMSLNKLLIETGAGGRWPVNRRQQCKTEVVFCPLWGQEYLIFREEREVELLKLFFLLLLSLCYQM